MSITLSLPTYSKFRLSIVHCLALLNRKSMNRYVTTQLEQENMSLFKEVMISRTNTVYRASNYTYFAKKYKYINLLKTNCHYYIKIFNLLQYL